MIQVRRYEMDVLHYEARNLLEKSSASVFILVLLVADIQIDTYLHTYMK